MFTENLNVLLIDDDLDDWEIFEMAMLQVSPAIKCVHHAYCQTAIEAVINRQIEPDYVFLDLNMPRMTGRECMVYLRRIEHMRHVPIIIYSTSNRTLERKELMEAGANFYITKTNTIAELVSQLRFVINGYAAAV